MRVFNTIDELKSIIKAQKKEGKSIGFVPTMGYLHEGHLSLARRSVAENEFTVLSVFVNPAQFGPNEDYDSYPRDIEGDAQKAESAGVDVLFSPSVTEMYPKGYNTFVEVFGITEKLCGKSRPGHFRGVCTVVLKLFNLVEADRAYFGQKDAQQAAVIRKMAKELNINTQIIACPIVREDDGLAMSSRNVYLKPAERKSALILSKTLEKAEEMFRNGERNAAVIKQFMIESIQSESLAEIDYVEVVHPESLEDIDIIDDKALAALAVKFGATRLIDNTILEV
jgi:pantoate--beta-alanine ligase